MSVLIKNGKIYGDHSVTLTQAQYDALSTTEKNNGTVYYITDGTASYPTAATTRYDHTDSGLTANSVQDAIDELSEMININTGDFSSLFKITQITSTQTSYTAGGVQVDIPSITNYTPIAIIGYWGTGTSNFTIPEVYINTSNKAIAYVKSLDGSSHSLTITFRILYVKSNTISEND